MAGTVSTIPVLSPPTFAARIADLYPRGWAGDDAKQTGKFYALLLSFADGLSFVQSELAYALDAQRLRTETYPELDIASVDYFGANVLPRPAGMTDAAYAALIISRLFRPVATRLAIQNALTLLCGLSPRMMEPWSPGDTGAWGSTVSYWNADSAQTPARWGNGSLRYQGYIETAPPAIPAIGPNNPILTWGTAYWNQPGYFFAVIQSASLTAVDDTVNRLRAYGTLVWLKLVTPTQLVPPVAPGQAGQLSAVATGTAVILVSWQAPAIGTPPFTYNVNYRQTGSTDWLTGPAVPGPSTTIQNLAAATYYDFQLITRNGGGFSVSPVVSARTNLIPPTPALNLQATQVTATAVTLLWSPPVSGSPPFTYSINYRINGTTNWQSFPVSPGAIGVSVINLLPQKTYDFQVVTTNL